MLTKTLLTTAMIFEIAVGAPTVSWAVNNTFNTESGGTTVNSSNFNPSNIQGVTPSCDNICGMLMTGGSRGSSIGDHLNPGQQAALRTPTSPNGGQWGPNDDLWCANHGFSTNVATQPNAVPTAITATSTCNVPMIAGDKNCQQVNAGVYACMFYGSQLESQCMAWTTGHDARTFDQIILALDVAAAATCTTACMASATGVGATMEAPCKWVGMSAGGAELTATLLQDSSPVAGTIHGLIAASSMVAAGHAGGYTSALNDTQSSAESSALENGTVTQNADGTVTRVADMGSTKELAQNKNSAQSSDQKAACVSAALFAVMSGVRAYDLEKFGNTIASACSSVQSLYSKAAAGNGGGNTTQNPLQSIFNPQTGQVTGGGPNGSGGGTGTIAAATPNTSLCGGIPCPTIPNTLGQNSAATDSGLLANSGLDKVVAPLAQHLMDTGLGDAIKQGAGAGLSGALGGAGGDFGAGLAQVAQQAQDHAGQLAGGFSGMSSGSAYAGGGGGGKAGGDSNPFASLFGGGAKDAGSRALSSETFGKSHIMDIWHTGTTQNLFEIVSGKVAQVTSRVNTR